jgi:hypothetical protein
MQSLFGQDVGCIVHETRPCVQDDRVASHFDLSRIIDKQVAGAIRLRNTRPRKSLNPQTPREVLCDLAEGS